MFMIDRRRFLLSASAAGATLAVAGCASTPPVSLATEYAPVEPVGPVPVLDPSQLAPYDVMYAAIDTEPFPVPAVKLSHIEPQFLRTVVDDPTGQPPGTIVVDPHEHYLYFVEEQGKALRYGVGVGRQGFSWNGDATINSKQKWPDWYPPKEMYERQPELMAAVTQLQSGLGVAGGPTNPLGARALYLWQGGKDTLYRIHGTTEPWTIGKSVSSGCIRMINQDVMDLYERVPDGTNVVVLGSDTPATI